MSRICRNDRNNSGVEAMILRTNKKRNKIDEIFDENTTSGILVDRSDVTTSFVDLIDGTYARNAKKANAKSFMLNLRPKHLIVTILCNQFII